MGRHELKSWLSGHSVCNICGEPYIGLAQDCRCTGWGEARPRRGGFRFGWPLATLIGALLYFTLLLATAGCDSVPLDPVAHPDEVVRFGRWHSDGPQPAVVQGVTFYVNAEVRIAPDSTCSVSVERFDLSPTGDYSTLNSTTCRAELNTWNVVLRYHAVVVNTGVQMEADITTQLAAQDPAWDVLQFETVTLIRGQ